MVAEPADLSLVPLREPEPGVVDVGNARETRAVRSEFLRLAALRALRRFWKGDGTNRVFEDLGRKWESASPQQRAWLNLADVFVTAYEEPP